MTSLWMKALLFDTFGTTVHWYGVIANAALGRETGVDADSPSVIRKWRVRYQPAIKPIRDGNTALRFE